MKMTRFSSYYLESLSLTKPTELCVVLPFDAGTLRTLLPFGYGTLRCSSTRRIRSTLCRIRIRGVW